MARFLLNNLGAGEAPHGISKVDTLYTLAKQAQALGAYKLARYAHSRQDKTHNRMRHMCVKRRKIVDSLSTKTNLKVGSSPPVLSGCL